MHNKQGDKPGKLSALKPKMRTTASNRMLDLLTMKTIEVTECLTNICLATTKKRKKILKTKALKTKVLKKMQLTDKLTE